MVMVRPCRAAARGVVALLLGLLGLLMGLLLWRRFLFLLLRGGGFWWGCNERERYYSY